MEEYRLTSVVASRLTGWELGERLGKTEGIVPRLSPTTGANLGHPLQDSNCRECVFREPDSLRPQGLHGFNGRSAPCG